MSDPIHRSKTFTRDELESGVCALLTDMTSDWDLDSSEPINGETRLMADLAFNSIDVVQLVVGPRSARRSVATCISRTFSWSTAAT